MSPWQAPSVQFRQERCCQLWQKIRLSGMLDQNFREPTALVHYVSMQNCEAVVPKPQHKSLKTAGLFLTSAKVLLIRLVMNFLSLISLSLAARVFRCYEFSPWLHLRQQECVYVILAFNKFLGLESRGPKQQFCWAYCNDTNLYHRGMEVQLNVRTKMWMKIWNRLNTRLWFQRFWELDLQAKWAVPCFFG